MTRREGEELSYDAEGRLRWGKRAAGLILQREDSGEIFLTLRSQEVMDPGLWGIPGGRVEPGEDPFDAAVKESIEELGSLPDFMLAEHIESVSGEFTYTTYHVLVSGADARRWAPVLNWENDDAAWTVELPTKIHPGVLQALLELGLYGR